MNVRAARTTNPDRSGALVLRIVLLGGYLLGTTFSSCADTWSVADAPLRFTFLLTGNPTHREAGYLARIPDGGILPGPEPLTRVVAEDGAEVESYTLWHGLEAGLWIVFADPGTSRKVDIYISASGSSRKWNPATGLRPSPLLVTDPATASLSAAKKLAGMGNIGNRVHVQAKAGINRAPLSVGGDDSGRPRPTSFYLQAYVATTDPGKTWIAPFFNEGQNEIAIDGTRLNPLKQSDLWGGTGQWMDLETGLHRVEFFCASEPGGSYSEGNFQGHAYLAWKTPGMPPSELGSVAKPDQPDAGKPAWAARIIKNHEIVLSGNTRLLNAESRDGIPIAVIHMEPGQNFWFEGEEQLAVYQFKAVTKDHPEDTTYTWTFEQGARTEGPEVMWLVPGLREHQVTLTAANSKGKSTQTVSFFAYPTRSASINNANDRLDFRRAMQTVLNAYPVSPDPCIQWDASYWNNLMRTMEYSKGYPLLENLLGKRLRTATQKLSREDLRQLEEIFLEVTPRADPVKALEWIDRFRDAATDAEWKAQLNILEAEIRMIYLDQVDEAEQILLKAGRAGGEEGERARIRLGDICLKRGELNKAVEIYADIQKKVRHGKQGQSRPGERAIDDWKLGAIKDAEHSKQVAKLVDEGENLQARQTLDRWERNFPLSKISEDFILRESQLYMKLGDLKRARWLLEPYCRNVDASSFLPDAAIALLRCMSDMNEPQEKMIETVAWLKERLKFHPVAEQLDGYIKKDRPPE